MQARMECWVSAAYTDCGMWHGITTFNDDAHGDLMGPSPVRQYREVHPRQVGRRAEGVHLRENIEPAQAGFEEKHPDAGRLLGIMSMEGDVRPSEINRVERADPAPRGARGSIFSSALEGVRERG